MIDPKIAKTQTRALSDAFSRANSPANPQQLFLHVDRNFSTAVVGLPRPIRTRDWRNEIRIRRVKEHLRASSPRLGHIRTRFNATHLSTPTENNVLHRCRRPHPPPRRPRAPRRLREVLQGACPRARLKSRRAICAVFLRSSPRAGRGRAGRAGPESRRGAATTIVSRRETPRTAASRVEAGVARRRADDYPVALAERRACAEIGFPNRTFVLGSHTGRTNR